jgi:hypothetical protein
VARSRVEAVRNVYAQGGFAKVLSLAEGVKCLDTVGFAFAQTEEGKCSEDQVLSTYLAADAPAHAQFAQGFVLGRIFVEGREWAEARVGLVGTKWRPEQQAEFLQRGRPPQPGEYGPQAGTMDGGRTILPAGPHPPSLGELWAERGDMMGTAGPKPDSGRSWNGSPTSPLGSPWVGSSELPGPRPLPFHGNRLR